MLNGHVTQLTIPLFPYMQPDQNKPIVTKRIRPQDALNLSKMVEWLRPSEICSLDINGNTWSVLSVLSPYSPEIHVMVTDTSADRYLPSPDRVPDIEGDGLMDVWKTILDFIGKMDENETFHVGFNWAPRSWGTEEEKTGFQSIPAKWHAMLWGWPSFPRVDESTDYVEAVDRTTLSKQARRLLGENDYAIPLCRLIRDRLEAAFPEGSEFIELLPLDTWNIDQQGMSVHFNSSILEFFDTPELFSQVLKPISVILDNLMVELCELMTDMDCRHIDTILSKTAYGNLNREDIQALQRTPQMRPMQEIEIMAEERGYPEGLISALRIPIEMRCTEKGDPTEWWRKGFGYAMVFSGSAHTSSGTLRIMPGVYVGSGGVVEALGVVLQRPEDRTLDNEEIKRKSKTLWKLKAALEKQYDVS